MPGYFLTGASGFVGRAVLDLLAAQDSPVTVLARQPERLQRDHPAPPGWTYLAGDLCDPDGYASKIPPASTVIHLASVTGKAPSARYRQVIVDGTRALLAGCAAADARRFVFVSSIAAGFPDQRYYPYARAKAEAERLVQASALDWVIARPTMVFGPGSPVLTGLATLAGGPVVLVPGAGDVPVQPIDRGDLARVLLALANDGERQQTIEIGGPDRVTMRQLLLDIRAAIRGSRDGPVIRLPLGIMRHVLGLLEPLLLPVLPLTAGQLASFANPTTAAPGGPVEALGPYRSLGDMLHDLTP